MPWLMKAEPDSRIVKGKDVKFSVDDFERIKISPWDGVRSHEARNIMRDKMKQGDKVLFYHSNTKSPGVYAIARVHEEGYPDYTAWDATHPYHDPKSSQDNPVWFMVSVEFVERVPHPPTLALIKHLASATELPDAVAYIGEDGHAAIKSMQLVNRGRLSVQPVDDAAFAAIQSLGTKGGWDDLVNTTGRSATAAKRGRVAVAQPSVEPALKKKKGSAVRQPTSPDTPTAPTRRSARRSGASALSS